MEGYSSAGQFAELGHNIFNDAMYGLNTYGNFELAQKQFQYQKNLAENRFQIMTKDLLKAGINPLFAVSGSSGAQPGVSGSTSPGKGGPSPTSMGMSAAAATNAKAALISAKANQRAAEGSFHKNMSEAELADERSRTENQLRMHYAEQAALNSAKTQAEHEKIDEGLYKKQAELAIAEAKYYIAGKVKISEEALAQHYSNWVKEKQSAIYKGKAGKVLSWIDYIADKLNIVPVVPIGGGRRRRK